MHVPDNFKLTPPEFEELVSVLVLCKGYKSSLVEKIKDLKGLIAQEVLS